MVKCSVSRVNRPPRQLLEHLPLLETRKRRKKKSSHGAFCVTMTHSYDVKDVMATCTVEHVIGQCPVDLQ